MSMEVNGSNGIPQQGSSTVKITQQDKAGYASIYNMLQDAESDKNDNWILDAKDFKDEALRSFAEAKGLIGKSWNAAIDYINGVIKNKKESVIQVNKDTYNEKTGELYDSSIQDGREVSRTYYKTDENGNKVVDEVIHLEYDESGNVHRKIYMDKDGNVKDTAIVSPDDETKVTSRTQYNDKGQWEKIVTYDENGDVTKYVTKKRDVDMYGQKRFTKETYTRDGDNWLVDTEKGFDDVKVTYHEPYISYEPKKD